MLYTMLEMVQIILNDMSGDEVNSIDDTIESEQVAMIIRGAYYDMMSNRNWDSQRQLLKISSSASLDTPNIMPINDKIKEIIELKYDKATTTATDKDYKPVGYLEPDDFLRVCNGRNSSNTDVEVILYGNVELLIANNTAPTYYTSFNDKDYIFDSWDSGVEDTLQSSKTQLLAYVMPTLLIEDDAVPELPVEAFSALIAEATSRSMFKLKQFNDGKAESESKKQNRWLANKQWTVNGDFSYPNYGRKSRR